jgi:MHS family proline/betaine transporter-like MFS transporter
MLRKQVFYCVSGTILEWYDFSLFASLTPLIAAIFFPKIESHIAILWTFAVFASGFIMRPIGAVSECP